MTRLSDIFPGGSATVTGGASGLGLATARALAAGGLAVSVLDLLAACERLDAGDLHAVPTDVSDTASVDRAFAAHRARVGPARVHVNCAGVIGAGLMFGREGAMTGEAFARVVEVNLVGSYNCARAAAEQMKGAEPMEDGGRGVIVNTSSIAAFDGMVGQVAYAASKGGIAAITLPMARELARFGIRVMAVAPGVFATPMVGGLPDGAREAVSALTPLFPARLGEPPDFAQLVVSIVANPLLNGEVIRLDGGLRMPPR